MRIDQNKYSRTISQDDLHLLEVPEFPDESIKNKFTDDRKPPPVKCICKSSPRQQPTNTQSPRSQQSLQREPSIAEEKPNASSVSEVAVIPASPNDKINYNDMKNTIEKLKNVSEILYPDVWAILIPAAIIICCFHSKELSETESDMKKLAKVNAALEERLTNEILSKRITENVELIELRQTVVECGTEFAELRREYLMLKSKTEAELDEEQRKISGFYILYCNINSGIIVFINIKVNWKYWSKPKWPRIKHWEKNWLRCRTLRI